MAFELEVMEFHWSTVDSDTVREIEKVVGDGCVAWTGFSRDRGE